MTTSTSSSAPGTTNDSSLAECGAKSSAEGNCSHFAVWCLRPPTSVSKKSTRTVTAPNGAKGSIWFWAMRVAGVRHLTCVLWQGVGLVVVVPVCDLAHQSSSSGQLSFFGKNHETWVLKAYQMSTEVVFKKRYIPRLYSQKGILKKSSKSGRTSLEMYILYVKSRIFV